MLTQIMMGPHLDHIVILVPHATLLDPPQWITANFTISPGGRHGDNKTENKLIVFQDGSYIELIAFIDDLPEHRKGHWWDKPFGIVDYAFTTQNDPDQQYAEMVKRLDGNALGVGFIEPKPGSRLREDGERISWKVTFPTNISRGEVPFWCHDVSPRDQRVPIDEASTTHPCGAVGVSRILTMVPSSRSADFVAVYEAVTGNSGDCWPFYAGTWQIETARPADGKPNISLVAPDQEVKIDEKAAAAVAARGAYICEVVLAAGRSGEKQKLQVDEAGLQHISLGRYNGP